MRVLDITVHTWDLARAIGADESLDTDAVAFVITLRDTVEAGRARGSLPRRPPSPSRRLAASPAAPPVGTTARRVDATQHMRKSHASGSVAP